MKGVTWGKVECQHDNIIIICSGSSLKEFDMNS